MNTISLTQKIHTLFADLEQQSGHTVPSATPVLDLYSDYCDWSLRHHLPVQDVEAFLLHLTHKDGCIPCRLPDGSVAVLGVVSKAMMASGVLQ